MQTLQSTSKVFFPIQAFDNCSACSCSWYVLCAVCTHDSWQQLYKKEMQFNQKHTNPLWFVEDEHTKNNVSTDKWNLDLQFACEYKMNPKKKNS